MRNKNIIKTNAVFLATAILATTSVYAATMVNAAVNTKLETGSKATSTNSKATSAVQLMIGNDVGMEDGTLDDDTMHTMSIGENDGVVMLSASVKSDTDLDTFTTKLRAKNTDVEDINFKKGSETNGEVSVMYKHNGKLLWLFPVTVGSETTVYSDANSQAVVNTSLSWWSFLVSGVNYDKAKLESSIKNDETVKSNISVKASATAKAAIAESIVAQLQANSNMEVK